jgi:hypothetical protein
MTLLCPRTSLRDRNEKYGHDEQSENYACAKFRVAITYYSNEKIVLLGASHRLELYHVIALRACKTWHSKDWESRTRQRPDGMKSSTMFEVDHPDVDGEDDRGAGAYTGTTLPINWLEYAHRYS